MAVGVPWGGGGAPRAALSSRLTPVPTAFCPCRAVFLSLSLIVEPNGFSPSRAFLLRLLP